MQTTTGGVAVVTTTLAQTDRRALSQAWYSALHLAERAQPHGGARIANTNAPRRALPGAIHTGDVVPRAFAAVVRSVPRSAAPTARSAGIAAERRRPTGVLARRIARIAARRAAAPERAQTATVTVRGARVHVIVRTHGGATRIVALCPAPLEARVAQALAQARFALAARGVRVGVEAGS